MWCTIWGYRLWVSLESQGAALWCAATRNSKYYGSTAIAPKDPVRCVSSSVSAFISISFIAGLAAPSLKTTGRKASPHSSAGPGENAFKGL